MNRRTNLFRPLLTALALAACSLVAAQGALSETGVAAAATEDSVLLRWLLPGQTYPQGGFVITREGGGVAMETALPAPLPREQAVAAGLVTEEEYDFLASVFDPAGFSASGAGTESGSPPASGAEFARAIATLTTVSRPSFARVTGTLYEDTSAQAGVSYTYTVRTAGGALVGSADVIGGDVKDLPAVTDLRGTVQDHASEEPAADADGKAVALRWARPDEEALLAAFNVYRLEDTGAVLLNADPLVLPLDEGNDPNFYVDSSVQIGGTYTYSVEGIDLFGRVAPLSEPVSIFVPDPRPLATPQIIDGEAEDLSITIRWAPPEDERARAVAVRRRTEPEGNATLTEQVLPLSTNSYTDDEVEGGVMYYYTLVSVDGSGRVSAESAIWAEQGYNPTPPSAPTALRATPQADGLSLTWAPPPETDVGSYRIYLSRQLSAGTEEFRFEAATVEPRYHLEMLPGTLTEVQVLVRAVNTSDVEGPVSNVVRGAALDLVAPPAPRLVEAVAAQGRIVITWAGTANPDVQALQLFRSVDGGEYELVQENLAPNALTWVDSTVQPGVRYSYRLEAVDASGNRSERSEAVSAQALDLAPPAPPTGVEAVLEGGGVRLSWQGANSVTYVVERARAGSARFVELGSVSVAEEYVDTRGAAGDVYRVRAVSANGLVGQPSEGVAAR